MKEDKIIKLKYKHSRGHTAINIGDFDAVPFNEEFPDCSREKAFLVTCENVEKLWGDKVRQWIGTREIETFILPDRESAKTLELIEAIYSKLHGFEVDRKVALVSLGGGTVSDVAGFAASTYLRGLPYINIPTTLLAQVDAAIGGKTGVNFRGGKNLVGTFYQPECVIVDTAFLSTLPARERASGLGEVIKCCFLEGHTALSEFVAAVGNYAVVGVSAFAESIIHSIRCKIRLVSADEFDVLNKRAVLNFGHTVGHALESAGSLSNLTHGEAVGLGMIAACHIAHKTRGFPKEKMEALTGMLKSVGLPVSFEKVDIERVLGYLKRDKKIRNGKLLMLLPDADGNVEPIEDVSFERIRESLSELQQINV